MSRWKQQDATVCIFGTVNCAFGENASDARRIVAEHNADCDAYEEKIAELQRRLDAVVMSLKPGEKPVREKLMDYEEWSLVLDRYAESKRIHTRALAIAEGREE